MSSVTERIRQVIVVEGKSDIAVVQRAVTADCIATEGFTLRRDVLRDIQHAYEKRGIIILTDPDGPGERIRARLAGLFPRALHAFVPKDEAKTEKDVGIEDASPAAVRRALEKVHVLYEKSTDLFLVSDLFAAGLSGDKKASWKRDRIGAILGIGYGNARQFVKRLNHFGITREEWNKALKILEDEQHA